MATGKILRLFFSLLLCAHIGQAAAQDSEDEGSKPPGRAQSLRDELNASDSDGTGFSGAYALVIGESEYKKGYEKLPGVKEDVVAIEDLFTKQGFDVEIIEDADSNELMKGITDFLEKYGVQKDARIIIYYAGHGASPAGDPMGYIVPIDSPKWQEDLTGFLQTAIPMERFKEWAQETRYKSRHILFMFDSCFSGTVFRAKQDLKRGDSRAIDDYLRQPVRQFITSGTADEEVPDTKSVFCEALVDALSNGLLDGNKDEYITGTRLHEYLYMQVTDATDGSQHPQVGQIPLDPNQDPGNFIFWVRPQPRPSTVTVTFDSNGGSPVDIRKIPFRDTLTDLPSPTRKHYTFGGWYRDPELKSPYHPTKISWDRILYARWDPIPPSWWWGFSAGTSFPSPGKIFAPVGIATPNVTFFPSDNWFFSFIKFGVDLGYGTLEPDIDYLSITPFFHVAWIPSFLSNDLWNLYLGVGFGYLMARTSSPKIDYDVWQNAPVPEATIGINFTIGNANVLTLPSVTCGWNIKENRFFNKISAGYSHRFK